MGIQLGLKHPDLRLIQFPLIFHQLLLISFQRHQHPIKPLRQLSQLVVALMGNIDIQIVVDHLADGPVKPFNGVEQLAAQGEAHGHRQGEAYQGAGQADGV